ncbi:DUF6495 family protein [Aureivirga sp. CE67]|uniref:DUF6495 family protein n=1 Tax=Aureivirga sp. CE67 TaxID=1788983 RepID=UPI0018CA326A|nr:DUF6495 family protein [Aureivirga sp. CE67]
MKYKLLSNTQFKPFAKEFQQFLKNEKISETEWDVVKEKFPTKAEEFSDLIWNKILDNTFYLEHMGEKTVNVFFCDEDVLSRIMIQVKVAEVNLLEPEGVKWLFLNIKDEEKVAVFQGKKKYDAERNIEIYNMVQAGCEITKGKLFKQVCKMI